MTCSHITEQACKQTFTDAHVLTYIMSILTDVLKALRDERCLNNPPSKLDKASQSLNVYTIFRDPCRLKFPCSLFVER